MNDNAKKFRAPGASGNPSGPRTLPKPEAVPVFGKTPTTPRAQLPPQLQAALRNGKTDPAQPRPAMARTPSPAADPVEKAVKEAAQKLAEAQTAGLTEVCVGCYPTENLGRVGIGFLDAIMDKIAGPKTRYDFHDRAANAIVRWALDSGYKWERRKDKIFVQCVRTRRPKNFP